jgi:hypothetical protein
MIRLDTGTPGAGKTLINVRDIVQLEKTNQKNIILNPKIYENNLTIIHEKNLEAEFQYCVRKVGQGVDLKDEVIHFEQGYFTLLSLSERSEEYFQRSIFYNEIIERINTEYDLKLNKLRPVRTIYTNISGLQIDTVRPIPADADWRKLPDGSYVVYDEIQNIPVFSSESRAVDPIVKDLTIHRHRGFDIVGITQFPDLVHKTFRAVTGHHRHLVNSFGLKRSTQYEWSTVKIDPNAFKNKATSEVKSTFAFPPNLYKYYRSSTAHTHKRRLPWRFILILSSVLIACFSLFMCSFSNDNNVVKQIATGKPAHDPSKPSSDKSDTKQSSATAKNDPSQIQNENANPANSINIQPDLDVRPAYDASDPFGYQPVQYVEPTSVRVFSGCFCTKKTCKAYDEQGTQINGIDPKLCKGLMDDSTNRPYNYFRQSQSGNQTTNQGQQQQSPTPQTENNLPDEKSSA